MFALADSSDILIKLAVKGGVLLVVGVVCFLWVFCKTKRVLSSFNRAIEAEDTAAFDALVRKHRKTLCDKEGGIFDAVFDYLLVNNSLSCMKVIFTHASAQEWQRVYLAQSPESEGPLWEAINYGSVDMLRLLLQHGMKKQRPNVCRHGFGQFRAGWWMKLRCWMSSGQIPLPPRSNWPINHWKKS